MNASLCATSKISTTSKVADSLEDLATQIDDFAQRIEDMLTAVLGPAEEQYTSTPRGYRKNGRDSFVINTHNPEGIPLTVEGRIILRLDYRYQCSFKDGSSYLQVDDSSITLRAESDPAPIVHYDYVRNVRGSIPAAHINIHASNDSATKAMLACGTRKQGKNRRKSFIEEGKFPTFSSLHFPVGGDRFRPGLEDVLQMAATEFAIDLQHGWQDALECSRQDYRIKQIQALVREFPDIAWQTLVTEGHDMALCPSRPIRTDRPSALIRY